MTFRSIRIAAIVLGSSMILLAMFSLPQAPREKDLSVEITDYSGRKDTCTIRATWIRVKDGNLIYCNGIGKVNTYRHAVTGAKVIN